MAMTFFTTVRTTPSGAVVSRYRNLQQAEYADVYQDNDGKWYLRALTRGGQGTFYFGAPAGYATEALAITALTALLP